MSNDLAVGRVGVGPQMPWRTVLRGRGRASVVQVVHHHLVGLDDAGEATGLDRHVGERRALVERQPDRARTAELEDLADAVAAT